MPMEGIVLPNPAGGCTANYSVGKIPGECPFCGRIVTFEKLMDDLNDFHYKDWGYIGIRYCPNPNCHHLILFSMRKNEGVRLYPPAKVNMNIQGITERMASILNEAATCYENRCYTAAAIMIRRALEHLCDENGAKGDKLYQRLANLKTKLSIPPEMFEAMHNLRYLGNDAAHVESEHYNEVGEEEVRVGLQVAKYIIESLHINVDLLDRLKKLRKDE
jgi:hypothetical protein